jgi:hypothetical protein
VHTPEKIEEWRRLRGITHRLPLARNEDSVERRRVVVLDALRFVRADKTQTHGRGHDAAKREVQVHTKGIATSNPEKCECGSEERRVMGEERARTRGIVKRMEAIVVEDARARGNESAPLGAACSVCDVTCQERVVLGAEQCDRIERAACVVRRAHERKRLKPYLPKRRHCECLNVLSGRHFTELRRGLESGGMRETARWKCGIAQLEDAPRKHWSEARVAQKML